MFSLFQTLKPWFLVVTCCLAVLTACSDLEDKLSDSGGGQENAAPKEEDVKPDYEAKVVGPNLNGDDWRGHFKSVKGAFDSISATINHVGNKVTIQTSRPKNSIVHKLSGVIDAAGILYLIDEHDGEDWTTLYGAVSKNSINLADYVFVDGSNADTNIIILKRNQK